MWVDKFYPNQRYWGKNILVVTSGNSPQPPYLAMWYPKYENLMLSFSNSPYKENWVASFIKTWDIHKFSWGSLVTQTVLILPI